MNRFLFSMAVMLLSGMAARAGFDWNLVTRSAEQERAASHIVVGRLEGYREVKAGPGPMSRFAAEVLVEAVEKGEGIVPGARLHVKFSSPRTLDQLEKERTATSGCGDEKVDPLPGERIRLYTLLNEDYEYVADHPQSFFYLGKAEPTQRPMRASRWVSAESFAGLTVGLLLGVLVHARRAGKHGGSAKVSPFRATDCIPDCTECIHA